MSAIAADAARVRARTCPECGGPKTPAARSCIRCHVLAVDAYTISTLSIAEDARGPRGNLPTGDIAATKERRQ